MTSIAVFIKKYSIGKSSPVLCMLDLLSKQYDSVDVYVQNVWCLNAQELKKENIRLINLTPPRRRSLKGIVHIFYCLFKKKNKPVRKDYQEYLCFDPHAFVLCKELFPESRPVYYSLELYFKENDFNMEYPPEIMNRERSEIAGIKGLIIQSEEREDLFRREYSLPAEIPTFILPVTYLKPSSKEKSFFVRIKYKIPDDIKIALHLGGIQEYFSCIELAMAFSKLDKWVLIFHGYYFGEYMERLRDIIRKNNIKNVIISDKVFDLIDDMDELLMSCDIGIAWYNNVSLNLTTSGKSSGKISAYLRFGLPVIANKYRSTTEAIAQTGCGLCVPDFGDIPEAVQKIENNYENYSDNARKEYDKVYWFENYRKSLIEFIRQ